MVCFKIIIYVYMLNTHTQKHTINVIAPAFFIITPPLSLAGGGRPEPRRGRNYATAPPAGRARARDLGLVRLGSATAPGERWGFPS